MPWCDTCDRFYNPNTLRSDGTCPTCGRQVAAPPAAAEEEPTPVPWHFKLLLVATIVYLGWRLFQGVLWLLERL